MEKPLFREESMNRISSPEELHDYLRVTTPRLWMLLGTILALLTGLIVYASTATLENTVPLRVQVQTADGAEDGGAERITTVSCLAPGELKDTVKAGMLLRLGKEQGRVQWIVSGEEGETLIFKMDRDRLPLADGEYDAELVTEATTPISFLWN